MTNLLSTTAAKGCRRPRRQPRSLASAVLAVFALLSVSACAPDAWRSDDPYEAFLTRVQNKCLYERIGRMEINADSLQDPYFLDLTSRFYNGRIPQAAFVANLQGAYDAQPDSPGVRCLLGQMPQRGGPDAPGTTAWR
ncbi:hypothetical protein [Candidatus Accumulibacter sp. ACC007]|uniref:hypothetical protein n=1 Tax=Candidatus Accumulibacter sp. ACC007 TaxID=2823333 RepID=UPI0025C578DB|nr:hypothetical protein [Candidatus Accumulibacter sp. ACC007]